MMMSALRLPRLLSQMTLAVVTRSNLAGPRATAMPVRHHQHPVWRSVCDMWRPTGVIRNMAAFSTHTGDAGGDGGDESAAEKPKKAKVKVDPRARKTVSSVGRKIHHRHLLLLSDEGESLGVHHRADVIRMMDEKGLKLVAVNENAEPPVFRLMTGKQIHQEQMRLHEKSKNKPVPTKMKEVTLSSDIAPGDLGTKLRQVASWLDKKHHIRVTLRSRHHSNTGDGSQTVERTLESMLSKMDVPFGFVSPCRSTREGRAASCTIRPPSEKERRAAMATAASGPAPASTGASAAMATAASGPAPASASTGASDAPSEDTPPPPSSQASTPAAQEGSEEKTAV